MNEKKYSLRSRNNLPKTSKKVERKKDSCNKDDSIIKLKIDKKRKSKTKSTKDVFEFDEDYEEPQKKVRKKKAADKKFNELKAWLESNKRVAKKTVAPSDTCIKVKPKVPSTISHVSTSSCFEPRVLTSLVPQPQTSNSPDIKKQATISHSVPSHIPASPFSIPQMPNSPGSTPQASTSLNASSSTFQLEPDIVSSDVELETQMTEQTFDNKQTNQVTSPEPSTSTKTSSNNLSLIKTPNLQTSVPLQSSTPMKTKDSEHKVEMFGFENFLGEVNSNEQLLRSPDVSFQKNESILKPCSKTTKEIPKVQKVSSTKVETSRVLRSTTRQVAIDVNKEEKEDPVELFEDSYDWGEVVLESNEVDSESEVEVIEKPVVKKDSHHVKPPSDLPNFDEYLKHELVIENV